MSPAEKRARAYAKLAPEAAVVTVTVEPWELLGRPRFIAQVAIQGDIDRIIITIGSGTTGRTRVNAEQSFNGGSHRRKVKVRDLSYRIRHLYIDQRQAA